MLHILKDLFSALQPPSSAADRERVDHTLQLASAVMLIEVMRADTRFGDAERSAVVDALRAEFKLSDGDAESLLELARRAAHDATDWFEFTEYINAHFDMPHKIRMIEYMWRVAYADGHLDAHERHVMWRLSDLLHIPHGAYINAKMRAKAAAGG